MIELSNVKISQKKQRIPSCTSSRGAGYVKALLLGAVLLFAFVPNTARAAHAMGGEVYYEYLGNGDFLISLIFYRECFSSNVEPG